MEADDSFNAVVDPQVRAYVYSLISALGGTGADEEGRYVLGDDALACLRDLKRWLKLYDERLNRLDVARCFAEGNLVNGDLLEILAAWSEDPVENRTRMKIALACLELLVPLTWPIERNDLQMTVNHHRHTPYLQLAQLSYKRGVLTHSTSKILRTVVRIGLPSIAQSMSERTSRDEGIIKLVLYFLRNIAMIDAPPNLEIDGDEADVSRSATIDRFHDQDILHLLLTISSAVGEDFNTQDVVILEVLFHLLKGIDVEKLFMDEKQLHAKHTNELQGLLSKELSFKREYARHAPTRHNRFGSMIWVKRDEDRVSTVSGQDVLLDEARSLAKMDKAKKWNKPRSRPGKKEELSLNGFDMPASLTPSANKHLRSFVKDFLDSAFNPLFGHIRKTFEREADRVLDIHPRQFFYLVSWFLEAERMRRKASDTPQDAKKSLGNEDDSFALIASVLTQETFIILTRSMRESYEMRQWQDLNAGMRCFTQILLTVQHMAESPLEEDQEVAENIQNRLFYEETTHELIILILRNYNDQGFGYLDACTELVHVHLRMLERYSKQNVDMQVRSRRRTRRKRKAAKDATSGGGVENENEGSEAEDIAEAHRTSTERKFDFKRFSAKFLTQSCINTFVKFISYYQDLDAGQLKRAHRFFYRVAFKAEMSVMLFRVDIIALLVKMMKGPGGLDVANPAWKEWDELVRQLVKKLIKKMGKRPELAVEMLFSKTNATAHFLEYGYTKQTAGAGSRVPAELEVRPGKGRDERIGIAVAALLDQGKNDALEWIKAVLSSAHNERQSWEAEAAAQQAIGQETPFENRPETAGKPAPNCPTISIKPNNEERRVAIFKDNKLRLLMTLVGFQREGDENDADATWVIPSSVTVAELEQFLDLVKKFENDPPIFDDGKVAADFIRRKQALKARHSTFGDEDDDDAADFLANDEEELLFPPGGPTNRKSDALEELKTKRRRRRKSRSSDDEGPDEAKLEARREKRRQTNLERMRAIKSDLYVHDSDDASDKEKDQLFFDKEAQLRRDHAQRVLEAMRIGAENNENSSKNKRKSTNGGPSVTMDFMNKKRKNTSGSAASRKKKRSSLSGTESEGSTADYGDSDLFSQASETEDEKGVATEEDTPLSSPHAHPPSTLKTGNSRDSTDLSPTVRETAGGDLIMADAVDSDGGEDEDPPAVNAARRQRVGGLVMDSESD